MSNVPPMELAVEPRLGWYLEVDPGLYIVSPISLSGRSRSHLGNGYSPRVGDGDIGERLSTESRGVEGAITTSPFPGA